MKRMERRTVLLLLGAVFFAICVIGLTVPAHAQSSQVLASSAADNLPIVRWIEGTGDFHSRQSFSLTNINIDWFGAKYRSTFVGLLFGIADWLWQLAFHFTVQAVSMDILKAVAAKIDRLAASLAQAIVGHGSAAGVLGIVAFLFLIWSLRHASRAGGFLRLFIPRLGAVALIFFFVSSGSTGGTTGYKAGSASWYVAKVNEFSNAVLSPVMDASDAFDIASPEVKNADKNDGIGCQAYVAGLRARYLADEKARGTDGRVAAVLSAMWEDSGMEVWKTTQFSSNAYADRVYCHLLDRQSEVEAPEAARAMYDGAHRANSSYSKALPNYPVVITGKATRSQIPRALLYTGSKAVDKAIVGLAACTLKPDGTWKADPALSVYGQDVSPEACQALFNPTSSNDHEFGNAFDWKDGAEQIEEHASGEAARFLNTLQGGSIGNAAMQGLTYLATSIIIFVVFGLLAVGIIVAKFSLIGMAALMPVILLMAVFPGQDTTGKLAKNGKMFVGYAFVSALAVIVLSIVAFVSGIIQSILVPWFGKGSLMATFVIGASPAFAAYILHRCFKKLGIPSPLSVKGAMSWGASAGGLGQGIVAGGIGGAVGGGIAGRMQSKALKKIGASASGAVKDRLAESRQYKPRRPTIDPSRDYSTSRHAVGWDSPLFTKSAAARRMEEQAQQAMLERARKSEIAEKVKAQLHPWRQAYKTHKGQARGQGRPVPVSAAWAAGKTASQQSAQRASEAWKAFKARPLGYSTASIVHLAKAGGKATAKTGAALAGVGLLAGASPVLAAGAAGLYARHRVAGRRRLEDTVLAHQYKLHAEKDDREKQAQAMDDFTQAVKNLATTGDGKGQNSMSESAENQGSAADSQSAKDDETQPASGEGEAVIEGAPGEQTRQAPIGDEDDG